MNTHLRSRFAIAIAIIALAGWYLISQVYYRFETHGHGNSVIWHEDEAYIFLGKETSGVAARRYQLFLQIIIGAFWYQIPAEKVSKEMTVFHIGGSTFRKYVIADFESTGGAFPYKGGLYFSRGGDSGDWPYVWRWNGSTFLRVPKEEALRIINSYPSSTDGTLLHSVTEQIKSEGWSEKSLSFYSGKTMRYSLPVQGRDLALVMTVSETKGETVVLEGRNGIASSELLSTLPRRYERITKEQYLKLSDREPSAPIPDAVR